ncbi:MAG: Permease of the drug/metabolite transporter superfamily [Cyanobacteria bacterium RYN_339]|nr:Permease of the drug/metabolite transporter superfamily [Cyanobacteria bacterium RYN_339]
MVASSLCFATMGVFVKLASAALPFYEVAFFRAFGGGLLAIAGMAIARQPFKMDRPCVLVWRGVLGWGALTTYFLAISRLPLGDAVLLNYTSPFFTALLAAAMLGEQLTARTLGCLAVATAGVACVVGPTGSFLNGGAAAAVLSAFLAAMAYVTVKRAAATNEPTVIVVVFSIVASLLSIPPMLWHFTVPVGPQWAWLAAAAFFGTVAQTLMTYGYRLARASTASVLTLTTPLAAAVLGILCLGAVPTIGLVVGGLLILGAGVALSWRDKAP